MSIIFFSLFIDAQEKKPNINGQISRLLKKLKQYIVSASIYNSLFGSGSGLGILCGLSKFTKLLSCGPQLLTSLFTETVLLPTGCTQQRFKSRIHQHLGASERSGLTLPNLSHSKPRNHIRKFKHNLSANNFRIVSTASSSDLSILETMHMHKEKPVLSIHQQTT